MKWQHRTKVYFPRLNQLVEKLFAKCVVSKVVGKKHQHPTLNITPTQKDHGHR